MPGTFDAEIDDALAKLDAKHAADKAAADALADQSAKADAELAARATLGKSLADLDNPQGVWRLDPAGDLMVFVAKGDADYDVHRPSKSSADVPGVHGPDLVKGSPEDTAASPVPPPA